MKKFLFIFTAVTLCGCISKVEEYIKENEPNIQTLEMINEEKADSVYSPHEDLRFLLDKYTHFSSMILSAQVKALDTNSKKDAIAILDSAIYQYEKEKDLLDEKRHICFTAVDYKSLVSKYTKKNKLAILAKYRINGNLIENFFYLNKKGDNIVYSDVDITSVAEDVLKKWMDISKYIENANDLLNDVKAGVFNFKYEKPD